MLELFKSNPDWNLAQHKNLRTLRLFSSSFDDLTYSEALQNLILTITSPHLEVEIFFTGEEFFHHREPRTPGHVGRAGELEGESCLCTICHIHRRRLKLLGELHEKRSFRLVLCANVRDVEYAKKALEVHVEAHRYGRLGSLLSNTSIIGVVSCMGGYGPVWDENCSEIPTESVATSW